MIEESSDVDVWTVFTVQEGKPIIEILKNQPQANEYTTVETNPTGIVTVSDSTGFIYKLRPGNRNSSIFGSISGEETEIKITDKAVMVGTNKFQNNMVSGFAVGLLVNNGGIAMGAGLPAEISALFNT